MSENEETNEGKLDSETPDAKPQEVAENSAEMPEEKKPTQPSPAKTTSILYGTRKRRPGAQAAPSAKTLDQIRGAYDDDDIIEIDDLPVKSNAPDSLIDDNRAAPPKRRERRERRDDPKDADIHSEETESIKSDIEAYPSDETPSEDRPKRFATVDESKRAAKRPIEEFSPTKDGKRAAPVKRARPDEKAKTPSDSKEKKGFLAWLKSLFSSEPEKPEPQRRHRPSNRSSNQRRDRGEGRNRAKRGDSQRDRSNRPEGRRPRRNRRPRGEGGPRRPNREGGGQRRQRRPQGERKQSPSE